MVILTRSQLAKASPQALKITAGEESNLPWPTGLLCPSWPMVTGYKKGTMPIKEYLRRYRWRLGRITPGEAREIYRLGVRAGGTLDLACFCRDGVFCHTYYAIKWLVEHDTFGKGFQADPGLAEFVDGSDWKGECWGWMDKTRVPLSEETQRYLRRSSGKLERHNRGD
jgi:hypothetical protein